MDVRYSAWISVSNLTAKLLITPEQRINEDKHAVKLTRLSCHRFQLNQARLWLPLIASDLGIHWRGTRPGQIISQKYPLLYWACGIRHE